MGGGLSESFRLENFIPGLIIGFIFGLFMDLSSPTTNAAKKRSFLPAKTRVESPDSGEELKLVCIKVSVT